MTTRLQLPLIGKVEKPSPWMIGLVAAGILGISAPTYFIIARTTPKADIAELTIPVQSKNLTVRLTASGSVVPVQSVNLSPKSSGRLTELYVEQGDEHILH